MQLSSVSFQKVYLPLLIIYFFDIYYLYVIKNTLWHLAPSNDRLFEIDIVPDFVRSLSYMYPLQEMGSPTECWEM